MKTMASVFEVLTFMGGLLGGLVVGWTLLSVGAKQANDVTVAASSALAVAMTAIPYCIAGAFHRAAMRSTAD